MMKSQEPPSARRPWPLAGPLPLLAALALQGPAGCRSVPPDPFEAFQTTLVELQEATDQVWEASVQLAQDRALGRVETSTALRRSNVIMRPAAEDSFGWEMEEPPLYFRLRESQRAFRELGGSFADYAALLVALSGGEISSAEEFEERAASLNANLRSAAAAMGLEGGPEETALISTVAAEALRSYLASQQRDALLKAVGAAQPAIDGFARLGGGHHRAPDPGPVGGVRALRPRAAPSGRRGGRGRSDRAADPPRRGAHRRPVGPAGPAALLPAAAQGPRRPEAGPDRRGRSLDLDPARVRRGPTAEGAGRGPGRRHRRRRRR